MIALFLRIVLGFALACLAVAATKVAFVITPADVLALEPEAQLERLARAGVLALAVATQTAVFTAPFAVIVVGYAYWQRISGWPYYVFSGLVISLLGLAVLFAAESPARPTIANAYAIAAYIFAGMIGGYVYWVVAGRAVRKTPPPGEATADGEPMKAIEVTQESAVAAKKNHSGANGKNRLTDSLGVR